MSAVPKDHRGKPGLGWAGDHWDSPLPAGRQPQRLRGRWPRPDSQHMGGGWRGAEGVAGGSTGRRSASHRLGTWVHHPVFLSCHPRGHTLSACWRYCRRRPGRQGSCGPDPSHPSASCLCHPIVLASWTSPTARGVKPHLMRPSGPSPGLPERQKAGLAPAPPPTPRERTTCGAEGHARPAAPAP